MNDSNLQSVLIGVARCGTYSQRRKGCTALLLLTVAQTLSTLSVVELGMHPETASVDSKSTSTLPTPCLQAIRINAANVSKEIKVNQRNHKLQAKGPASVSSSIKQR